MNDMVSALKEIAELRDRVKSLETTLYGDDPGRSKLGEVRWGPTPVADHIHRMEWRQAAAGLYAECTICGWRQ